MGSLRAAAVAVVALVVSAAPSSHAAPPPELGAIARAALGAADEYLVTGRFPASAPPGPWLAPERADLDVRRAALAGSHIAYTWHEERLVVLGGSVALDRAVLHVRAGITLGMAGINGNFGTPPYTSGEEEPTFLFRRVAGVWVLTELVDDPRP
ncbi:MAG TPA: hypothetical protein VFQ85_16040 [Mycobacteriales bacterium]|jgi:hypothetical protein|nr:hypothetical protein [Mycobacteriales bacterium]